MRPAHVVKRKWNTAVYGGPRARGRSFVARTRRAYVAGPGGARGVSPDQVASRMASEEDGEETEKIVLARILVGAHGCNSPCALDDSTISTRTLC